MKIAVADALVPSGLSNNFAKPKNRSNKANMTKAEPATLTIRP